MSEHARHDDATTGDGGRAAVAWRPSALGIAQIVVRNLVPVAGILFFGWPVFNVLALYLVDTLLTIAAISAAVGRSFAVVADTGTGARVKMEMSVTVAGIFIAGFMAMPLGVPLIFMTNGDMAMMRTTFTDHGFRIGALVQAALVLWTYIGTRRAMAAGATPASLGLKRQFALVFLRWIAVLMVVYFGVGQLLLRGDRALPFGPALAVGTVAAMLGWQWIGPRFQPLFFDGLLLFLLGVVGGTLMFVLSFLLRLTRRQGGGP